MIIQEKTEEINRIKKRNLWALFFIGLIYGFASKPFFIVFQPFLLEKTGSLMITGILVTLGGILMFLPKPWAGKLSDKFSRKKIWLLEVPLYFLGMIFLIFAVDLIYLILGTIFFHFSAVFGDIGFNMYIEMSSDKKKKGMFFGLMIFSIFIGNIGGEIFVLLNNIDDVRVYFVIYMVFDAINYLIITFIISTPKSYSNISTSFKSQCSEKRKNIWSALLKNREKRSVLIFFVLDMFIYNISFSILSAGLRAQYSLTYEQLALISICQSISLMIFQIPAGRLTDKIGTKKSLILCEFIGVGVYFCFILTFFLWLSGFQSLLIPLLCVSFFLIGLNAVTFIPSAQVILTDLDETRRAESYGMSDFLRGVGFMPTGIIGGILTERVGYIFPFILSFIGIIFLILYLIRFFHDGDGS